MLGLSWDLRKGWICLQKFGELSRLESVSERKTLIVNCSVGVRDPEVPVAVKQRFSPSSPVSQMPLHGDSVLKGHVFVNLYFWDHQIVNYLRAGTISYLSC